MNLKAVLVYPPMTFGRKRNFGFPPLGVLYIATYLQKKGIKVKLIDGFIEGYTLRELTELILREGPDIVGFSAMTCQINSVLDIAKELKKKDSFLKIAVGGPHISSTKEELFNFTKDLDFLIYGEGEEAFYQLVSALKDGSFGQINGLIYTNNDQIIKNEPSRPIKDLDGLPFPDLDLLDIRNYDSYYARTLPLTSIMASRGCPFNCIFCDSYATHGKALRLRSPRNIVDEIEYNYNRHRIKQFMIKDSTFTVNKSWVYDICVEIKKRNLRLDWTCNTRVDFVDIDLLAAMKRSGCYQILFGIESGTQKILDTLRKGITIEQIREGIKLCKKAGIEAAGYFIVGNPGETEGDARKTVRLAKELNLDMVTFGVTTAYPGTEIYQWAISNKALEDRYWYMRRNLHASDSIREVNGNLDLSDFPAARQAEVVKEANKSFYLQPSYIFKSILKIRGYNDINRVFKAAGELLKN